MFNGIGYTSEGIKHELNLMDGILERGPFYDKFKSGMLVHCLQKTISKIALIL